MIYIASKTRHAETWKQWRERGTPIVSTWIDEAGPGETASWADPWTRCVSEASTAASLVVYCEPGDVLKGAFVEAWAALAFGVPVFAVGCEAFSFVNHPLVTQCRTIDEAFECAIRCQTEGTVTP